MEEITHQLPKLHTHIHTHMRSCQRSAFALLITAVCTDIQTSPSLTARPRVSSVGAVCQHVVWSLGGLFASLLSPFLTTILDKVLMWRSLVPVLLHSPTIQSLISARQQTSSSSPWWNGPRGSHTSLSCPWTIKSSCYEQVSGPTR